jgi:hypothetical protein
MASEKTRAYLKDLKLVVGSIADEGHDTPEKMSVTLSNFLGDPMGSMSPRSFGMSESAMTEARSFHATMSELHWRRDSPKDMTASSSHECTITLSEALELARDLPRQYLPGKADEVNTFAVESRMGLSHYHNALILAKSEMKAANHP